MQKMSVNDTLLIWPFMEKVTFFWRLKRPIWTPVIPKHTLCPSIFFSSLRNFYAKMANFEGEGGGVGLYIRSWDRAQFRFFSSCPFGGLGFCPDCVLGYSKFWSFLPVREDHTSRPNKWGPHCATLTPPPPLVYHTAAMFEEGFQGTPLFEMR